MFARPSSSAYVCLRCQVRLTRQNPHALSSSLRQRSAFSVSCLRPFHNTPPARWTDPLGPIDDNGDCDSRSRRRDKYHHPLGKLRGKKGGRVRENAEALSIKTLGQPAEVIVLRDDPHNDLEEAIEQEDAGAVDGAAKGSSSEAILHAIQGEDILIDQETVNQQIDALRPRVEDPNSGRLILPAKEYFRLCKVLTDSYSRPQLDAYMARWKDAIPVQALPEAGKSGPGTKDPEISFRPWRVVNRLERIQKHLSPADTKNSRRLRRSKLASTLLQRCWKVEVAEEVERLGELVCILPKAGIRLLAAGKPSYLDEISDNRQVKIEVDGPKSKVRIVADKDSAIYAFEDINRLWSLRHTEQFQLKMPASGSMLLSNKDRRGRLVAFRPEDVAMVSGLTRTTMTYVNSMGTAVAIDGVGKESVEDATRTLLALIDIPTKQSSMEIWPLPENNTDIVLQEISDLDALPYRDRRSPFGRFSSPATRTPTEALITELELEDTEPAEQVPTPDIDMAGDQGCGPSLPMAIGAALDNELPDILLEEFIGDARKPPSANKLIKEDKFWDVTPESCISASLGLVLHPKAAELASRISPIPKDGLDDAIFLHRIPGFSHVLPYLSWNRENIIDVLSFRLLHNPWRQPGPALPEIRLDFAINSLNEEERSAEFKGLYALSTDRRGQVMLPSKAVDLCFKRKKIFQAKLDSLENQPDVKQFIEQTKANILDGSGRLRAPGSVLIRIPFAIAELLNPAKEGGPKNAPLREPENLYKKLQWTLPEVADKTGILACYHFVGVEHWQIAGYTFEGHPVRYTSVEGGKLGGKYGNLEIFMSPLDSAEQYADEKATTERTAFSKAVLRLVNLVDQAAHGMLARPGPIAKSANANQEIDQEGMERWTPEYLDQTTLQSSAGHEVDGTEGYPGGELLSAGHHATVATQLDTAISSRLYPEDASQEAPPAANLKDAVLSIEAALDEIPAGHDRPIITNPGDTIDEDETGNVQSEHRGAASG